MRCEDGIPPTETDGIPPTREGIPPELEGVLERDRERLARPEDSAKKSNMFITFANLIKSFKDVIYN